MDLKVTPSDKINTFVKIYQIVVDAIDVFNQKSGPAGADDTSPLIVYLILKAIPKQLCSTIKYF